MCGSINQSTDLLLKEGGKLSIILFCNFKHHFLLLHREKEKRIGDSMTRLAPFLKLYTEYVKNFQNASDLVETWTSRSSEFNALMKEAQVMPAFLCFTTFPLKPVIGD